MFRPIITALCCTLFANAGAAAQAHNLENDTIRVSSGNGALVLFGGELDFVSQNCADYSYAMGERDVTVRVRNGKPRQAFCKMLVREGSKDERREHEFILQYVETLDASEQVHDYRSNEKIAERMARNRSAQVASPALTSVAAAGSQIEDRVPSEPRTAVRVLGIDSELIARRVRDRINKFYLACSQLGRKEDIGGAIDFGMKLFNDREDAMVEVRTSAGESRMKRIRQYFTHLSQLPYRRVEMTSSQIMYVTDFIPAPDGRWFGTAQIIQDFRGFKDGNLAAYIDRTNKTIKLELKTFTKEVDGRTVTKFEIFLSDIAVTSVN